MQCLGLAVIFVFLQLITEVSGGLRGYFMYYSVYMILVCFSFHFPN